MKGIYPDMTKKVKNSLSKEISPFKELKSNKWQFILYPDSAPNDWLDLIRATGVKACISPCHDQDHWTEQEYEAKKEYCDEHGYKPGDLKKEHYHVMIIYSSPTTYNNIKVMFVDRLKQPDSSLEIVASVSGCRNYYFHDGLTDKAKYNESDLIYLNGFNYRDYIEINNKESFKIKCLLTKFIIENAIKSFTVLMYMLIEEGFSDWVYVLQNNSTYFTDLIKDVNKIIVNHEEDQILLYKELAKQLDINLKENQVIHDIEL